MNAMKPPNYSVHSSNSTQITSPFIRNLNIGTDCGGYPWTSVGVHSVWKRAFKWFEPVAVSGVGWGRSYGTLHWSTRGTGRFAVELSGREHENVKSTISGSVGPLSRTEQNHSLDWDVRYQKRRWGNRVHGIHHRCTAVLVEMLCTFCCDRDVNYCCFHIRCARRRFFQRGRRQRWRRGCGGRNE